MPELSAAWSRIRGVIKLPSPLTDAPFIARLTTSWARVVCDGGDARGTRSRPEKPSVEEIATLEAAVEHAGQLISDNWSNVTAQDGKGNAISGDDFLARYLGLYEAYS